MKLLQLVLRIQKSLGDRVTHKLLAKHLEFGEFVLRQFEALALPHAQQIAEAIDLLILEFEQLVAHEVVEFLLQCLKILLLDDGLAKVQRALGDGAVFGCGVHGFEDSRGFSIVQSMATGSTF